MAATFVRWNPRLNHASGHDLMSAAYATKYNPAISTTVRPSYLSNWTVRVPRKTNPADEIFMTLWDDNGFAGLLGYGIIAGPQYLDVDWRHPDGEPATYVPIRWLFMLNRDNAIAPLDALAKLPGAKWPARESGEILPGKASAAIRELFAQSEAASTKRAKKPMKSKLEKKVRIKILETLLGEITPNMRAILITTFKKSVRVRFVFGSQPTATEEYTVLEVKDELESLGSVNSSITSEIKAPGLEIKVEPNEQWLYFANDNSYNLSE